MLNLKFFKILLSGAKNHLSDDILDNRVAGAGAVTLI